VDVGEVLEMDQAEDFVACCEAGDSSQAMLEHSFVEVAGDAGVEGAGVAGEDVDGVGYGCVVDSRFLTCREAAGFGMTGSRNLYTDCTLVQAKGGRNCRVTRVGQ
jgi:hypothetical protein